MKKNLLFIYFILFFWPYFFLFPITLDIITIGNDFELLYFSYKKYIFELVSSGVIPLWSPAEGVGFPIISNPFAQFFYPLSWFLYSFYIFINNFNTYHFALYTIFAISIFNFGQFFWLRSLKFNTIICLVSTIVLSVSLKFTEILRFPNAIHAACWIPWIFYGLSILKKDRKKIKSFLILAFSILSVFTAGYPYYIFYIFLCSAFYYFFHLYFCYKNNIFSNSLFLVPILSIIFVLVVVSPYFYAIFEMLKLMNRANVSYEFATEHGFTLIDILGSFFFPPAASTEGRFYISSISTLLFFLIIFIKIFYSSMLNVKQIYILPFLFFIIFVINLSMSKNGLFFHFFWENFPFIGYIRTWPRINIILIPFFSVIVAIAIENLIEIKNKEIFFQRNFKNIYYFIFFYIISVLLIQIIFINFDIFNKEYWGFWQKKRFFGLSQILPFPLKEYVDLHSSYIYSFYLILSLIFLVLYFKLRSNLFSFLILGFILLSSLELFLFSNIQWAIPSGFYKTNFSKAGTLGELKKSFLRSRISNEVHGFQFFRDNYRHNVNYFEDWGYQAHHELYKKYFNLKNGSLKQELSEKIKKNVLHFYGMDDEARRIFFSDHVNFNSIEDFIINSKKFEKENNISFRFDMDQYNGNIIKIIYNTQSPAILSFIDNWDNNWTATIDGKSVNINKLFGAYKSIEVPGGSHTVIFSFKIF